MSSTVVVVFWLITGQPAFDYLPSDQCQALQTMTKHAGSVELQLADGSILTATSLDCLPLLEAKAVETQ